MCSVKHFQKSRTTVNKQKVTLIPQLKFDAFTTLRLSLSISSSASPFILNWGKTAYIIKGTGKGQ